MPDVIRPEFESRGQHRRESVEEEETSSDLGQDERDTKREEASLNAGAWRTLGQCAADEREAEDERAPRDDGGEEKTAGANEPPHSHGRGALRNIERNPQSN